jgi:hypothetical protein
MTVPLRLASVEHVLMGSTLFFVFAQAVFFNRSAEVCFSGTYALADFRLTRFGRLV